MEFSIKKNQNLASAQYRNEIFANPGFGKYFTDHMVEILWSRDSGWHKPKVIPYGAISLFPAAAVLHYGQSIFEGTKISFHSGTTLYILPQAFIGNDCPKIKRKFLRLQGNVIILIVLQVHAASP